MLGVKLLNEVLTDIEEMVLACVLHAVLAESHLLVHCLLDFDQKCRLVSFSLNLLTVEVNGAAKGYSQDECC